MRRGGARAGCELRAADACRHLAELWHQHARIETARAFFGQQCEHGNGEACYEAASWAAAALGRDSRREVLPEQLAWYHRACQAGELSGCGRLAQGVEAALLKAGPGDSCHRYERSRPPSAAWLASPDDERTSTSAARDALSSRPLMLKRGDTFGRYTIEALIGQGGMGCVYRAYDPRLERRVALKVISEGPATASADARLLREARAAAAFDHPNAVAIFDVGELDGTPFIVMELVEGRTLRRAPGDAELPVSTRVAQLADIARALSAAHERGLVHRDIKPENVMIRGDGSVKVLDFGIARRTGGSVDPQSATQPALATLTVEGVKLGTPVYMAPEQIRGDALDGRADQFAWGVLAYELLAGQLPWRGAGDALAVMASALTDPVDGSVLERAGVSRAVARVVLRALEKRPEARFPSMDELRRALESAARGEVLEPEKGLLAGSTTQAQQFSTSEVREVLGQAIERQAAKQTSTRLGFDELIAVAAEVGVDVESLREASRALRVRSEEERAAHADSARRDGWLRQQRLLFYRHAGIYAIVNAALLVFGLVLLSFTPWWVWFLPGLAWGVGLAIHALMAFTANEHDWREHERGMRWWLDKQQPKKAALPGASAARGSRERAASRRRVALPNAEPRRVASDVEEDAAQDADDADDAFASEPAMKRRKRRH